MGSGKEGWLPPSTTMSHRGHGSISHRPRPSCTHTHTPKHTDHILIQTNIHISQSRTHIHTDHTRGHPLHCFQHMYQLSTHIHTELNMQLIGWRQILQRFLCTALSQHANTGLLNVTTFFETGDGTGKKTSVHPSNVCAGRVTKA